MECFTNSYKALHQKTLAETWFYKKNDSKAKNKGDSNSDSSDHVFKKFKTPTKMPLKSSQLKTRRSNSNATERSASIDKDNTSDDSKIVDSSEDATKIKLSKKLNKKLPKKFKTPQSTPHKSNNVLSPDSTEKKLSISDICDVSSTVIKDELIEMFDDIIDYESIEMTHDLSGLITNEKLSSNILEYSPLAIGHSNNMDLVPEDKENLEELQDPLFIDNTEKNDETPKDIKKRRKTTSKSKKLFTSSRKHSKIINKHKTKIRSDFKTKIRKTEDDSLSEELIQELKVMGIQLQHEVPPQHKIENNAGSRPLSEKQIIEFEKYGPLKRGPYSQSEDEIIKNNWKNFCDIHDWNKEIVEPFLLMRHNGKYYIPDLEERKNFVRFLANGLPWRSLYSVYYRFRNLFNIYAENGKYTSKEDKIIISHMCNASETTIRNKCAEVARILHRKRHSIWQHFQKLKRRQNLTVVKSDSYEDDSDYERRKQKRRRYLEKKEKINITLEDTVHEKVYTEIKWTSPLVKKFLDTLVEVTSCKELKELKNQVIDQEVWMAMEKQISVDNIILKNFWYLQLHMQLFCPSPIYLNDLKIKLIIKMHEKKLQNLEEIIWEEVQLNFNGVTTCFLSKLFDTLLQYAKTKVDSSQLKDIVEYLYKNYIPELEKKTTDCILPKLYYKSGRIMCLDKGSEKKIPNRTTTNPFSDEHI